MSMTVVMSAVLVLGGLGGAATSDFQVFEKLIRRDKNLLGDTGNRHSVRKQPHQQIKTESRKSLGVDLNLHVAPTTSKLSLPTIVKLHPPTPQPVHLHPNMPLRFGRDGDSSEENGSSVTPNLPQRFGRSWELLRVCAKSRHVREAANPVLPQRFGRNIPSWSLLRALAGGHLAATGLRCCGFSFCGAEDFEFTSSSEENMEVQEKNF